MQGFFLWPAKKMLPANNAAKVIAASIVSEAPFMLFKLPTDCLTAPNLRLNCISTVPQLCSGVREHLQVEPHCQQDCSKTPKGEDQQGNRVWASVSPISS